MQNIKLSGFIILFLGVVLLVFTFFNAYQLLIGVLDIPISEDFMSLFGESLAPLIAYAIRALFLGIMGWIGSILTKRGIQILTTLTNLTSKQNKETKKEPVALPEAE
jgi:hypothetical protein